MFKHVHNIVVHQKVRCIGGVEVPIQADTFCIQDRRGGQEILPEIHSHWLQTRRLQWDQAAMAGPVRHKLLDKTSPPVAICHPNKRWAVWPWLWPTCSPRLPQRDEWSNESKRYMPGQDQDGVCCALCANPTTVLCKSGGPSCWTSPWSFVGVPPSLRIPVPLSSCGSLLPNGK